MTENTNKFPQVEEIQLVEVIAQLWRRRGFIAKWGLVGALVGLLVAFSIPKSYRASVILAPETEQKVGSGVSSIASMMGVSLDNSVDAISVEMFPDVVASTPFVYDLLDLNVTFERKKEEINTTLLDYMLNYQKTAWWSHILRSPFTALRWLKSIGKEEVEEEEVELDMQNLPAKHRSVIKYLSKSISVIVEKKTGKTTISMEMQDPVVVATVVEAVKTNLTEYITNYRTSKVRQDVKNLTEIFAQRKEDYYSAQQAYADAVDANKNIALVSVEAEIDRLRQEMNLAYQVYAQIATQLEGARIKEQEAKPVFATLEPVITPNRPCAPSKSKLFVGFAFFACCAAGAWVLFGEKYWKEFKENL